jgi:hypothetical protein
VEAHDRPPLSGARELRPCGLDGPQRTRGCTSKWLSLDYPAQYSELNIEYFAKHSGVFELTFLQQSSRELIHRGQGNGVLGADNAAPDIQSFPMNLFRLCVETFLPRK